MAALGPSYELAAAKFGELLSLPPPLLRKVAELLLHLISGQGWLGRAGRSACRAMAISFCFVFGE